MRLNTYKIQQSDINVKDTRNIRTVCKLERYTQHYSQIATGKTHKTLQSSGNLKDTQNTTVKWQLERHTKHYSQMTTWNTHKTLQSNGNLKDTQNTTVKWQLKDTQYITVKWQLETLDKSSTVKWQLDTHTKHYSPVASLIHTQNTTVIYGILPDRYTRRHSQLASVDQLHSWNCYSQMACLRRYTIVILKSCGDVETNASGWKLNYTTGGPDFQCKLYTTFNGHLWKLPDITPPGDQEFHPWSACKVETALQWKLRNTPPGDLIFTWRLPVGMLWLETEYTTGGPDFRDCL